MYFQIKRRDFYTDEKWNSGQLEIMVSAMHGELEFLKSQIREEGLDKIERQKLEYAVSVIEAFLKIYQKNAKPSPWGSSFFEGEDEDLVMISVKPMNAFAQGPLITWMRNELKVLRRQIREKEATLAAIKLFLKIKREHQVEDMKELYLKIRRKPRKPRSKSKKSADKKTK